MKLHARGTPLSFFRRAGRKNIICSEDKETYISTNYICSIDLCNGIDGKTQVR
jgi:hypothetical protein